MTELAGLTRQVRLARYTSLKVGGAAEWFVEVRRPEQAAAVLRWAAEQGLACRWLGGGSNLLVSDGGLDGLAARYRGDEVAVPKGEAGEVVGGAGRSFSNLARALARAGWSGLEWAATVPGTLGGAVANNAGAFGSSVADDLAWAEIVRPDASLERLRPERLGYAYRASRFKRGELAPSVIVRAAFRVRRAPPAETVARVGAFQAQRTATQPRQLSAGSVFANPAGDWAGRLIETAGLKGRRVGAAQISEQHANFIVNLGGATAADVFGLVRLAQEVVWERAGRWLEPEIELLGRWTAAERAALRSPGSGSGSGGEGR